MVSKIRRNSNQKWKTRHCIQSMDKYEIQSRIFFSKDWLKTSWFSHEMLRIPKPRKTSIEKLKKEKKTRRDEYLSFKDFLSSWHLLLRLPLPSLHWARTKKRTENVFSIQQSLSHCIWCVNPNTLNVCISFSIECVHMCESWCAI